MLSEEVTVVEANGTQRCSDLVGVLEGWVEQGSRLLADGYPEAARAATYGPDLSTKPLAFWAELGLQVLTQLSLPVDWKAVDALTESTKTWHRLQSEHVRSVVARSNQWLAPFGDPLSVDFGAHRWLADDREEAYSDWLAWIVRELREPDLVLGLFAIHNHDAVSKARNASFCTPDREVWILNGTRRLDLVIRYKGAVLIVVEVKVTSADSAETAKQEEYFGWMRGEPEPCKFAVLLATEGREEEYNNFKIVPWAHVCIQLRRLAPKIYASKSPIVAAMVLAFVGGVEQNLLRYSIPDPSHLEQGRLTSSEAINHIAKSLEGGSDYGNQE
jgi:hypothetical protein